MRPKLFALLLLFTATFTYHNAIARSNNELAIQQTAENKNWIGTGISNFDLTIIHFLQRFSQKNRSADEFIAFIAGTNLFKGGFLIIALWCLWFRPGTQELLKRKELIILTLVSGFLALSVGRILVMVLPFRQRPMNFPELHLTIPYGANFEGLAKMSSFPSDHAVLFFVISTGLYFISKKIGILAFLYTILFIAFPRIYLCYHYPSDIIVGALIGISMCWVICNNSRMQQLGKKIYNFSEQKPQFFYPVFFFITYQLIELFGDMRDTLSFIVHHV